MADGALAFRVLDLADEQAVYGTKLLADMGADVIRVECPGGDSTRRRGPFFGEIPHPERSLYSMYMNTNKRGVTLNIEVPAGREIFIRLVKTADALVETFPVGYLAALDLGYDRLKEINPQIVVTSVTPFGQTGPYQKWKGADIVQWAMANIMWCSGLPDRAPLNAPDQAYVFSGFNAAIGTLTALWGRQWLGVGQHVDVSVHESLVNITSESGVPKYLDDLMPTVRNGSQRPGQSPLGCHPCKDGWANICCAYGTEWDAMAKWIYEETGDETALGEMMRGTSAQRYLYEELIILLINSVSVNHTKQELFEEGQRRGVPWAPVSTVADLVRDKQLHALDFWEEVQHEDMGKLAYPGAPYIFSESPWSLRRPAPKIGQHNEEIFAAELGVSKSDLESMKADGVV